MDTVTQVLLGAAVAEGGFRKKLGGKATAIGALCGLLPDLDLVVGFAGGWAYLQHHRGFSHSFFALILISPLVAWLGYRWSKKRGSFGQWWHLALWALLTHILLDWCTTYGTQLLWPFTNHRFALNAVPIIDPLYSIPLLLALVLAIIPQVSDRVSQPFALAMVIITTGYIGLGYVQSQRALSMGIDQLKKDGFAYVKVQPKPALFNIWVWRILAKDKGGNFRIGQVSTWNSQPIVYWKIPAVKGPLVDKALACEKGKIFYWFAAEMVSAQVKTKGKKTLIVLSDQRYGLYVNPLNVVFKAQATFDEKGRLEAMERLPGPDNRKVEDEFAMLWHILTGGDPPRPPGK